MSPEREASFESAESWSSARLRSLRMLCACSWLFQKSGPATRSSRDFRRARFCCGSKITPHKGDALLQAVVLVFQIFENHAVAETSGGWFQFAFLKVSTTRIAETATHIQANQSLKRV